MEDQNKKHAAKLVAPCVITALIGGYYFFFGILVLCVPEIPGILKFLLAVIPAALLGVTIYVLVERIQEIRSGEEDDLSKY
ncbi:MAG: hypothetical protein K2P76_06890 [Lachnospiraceae bacterium]|nr:hypothetical protein [Lachnospiraceae bacterium]MDE6982027.1 hypothetical protein [Lachnospiraceae bacterium]